MFVALLGPVKVAGVYAPEISPTAESWQELGCNLLHATSAKPNGTKKYFAASKGI
jgi:hypothetical protein